MVPVMSVACADSDPGVVHDGMAAVLDCVRAADRLDAAQLRPIILQACADARFPFAATTRAASFQQDTCFANLVEAVGTMLRWPEGAVDPARLHPLAQRLVDGGLLPLIEGQY